MGRFIVAITGASGIAYGVRLIQELEKRKHTVYAIISPAARTVAKYDGITIPKFKNEFEEKEMTAPIASGSFSCDGMAIIPCSMKTLGAIANTYADDLIRRAADVSLKERRKLVIVPREMPYSTLHLQNMLRLSEAGAIILPPSPGFYGKPKKVDDLIDSVVGRALDLLGVENEMGARWKGGE